MTSVWIVPVVRLATSSLLTPPRPALKKSDSRAIQTNCARELVFAGRPAGFGFIAQSIERNQNSKPEMIQFVRDQFPELRAADEKAILAFVKQRAI